MYLFRKKVFQCGLPVALAFCLLLSGALAYGYENIPVRGMVTMLDLGAKTCIPCKMMAPILEKLEKVYEGKVAILFINLKEEKDKIERFGIRAIPTQIFFDEEGKEIYRHVGFMSEEAIVAQLKKMGIE